MDNPVLIFKGEEIEVKKIFYSLFKHETTDEMIRVWYEDFDGYLVYEKCMDSLRKKRKIPYIELFRDYERVWEDECS
ncbi:hypothetical protein U2I53_10715 [Lysinibacillus capsici]|uniref:hypothetical protein n=1 Tax=Lysinibacillus capsici TaxID=2115968 RepID=UPI0032DEEFD5